MKIKQQKHQQPEHSEKSRGLSFRAVEVETVEEDGKAPMVRMSVSSETPVLSYVRVKDQTMIAYEILDHSESSIDRSRCADGLVIQDTHNGDQIGLIRAPVVMNRKLGGIIEFCTGERAQEIGMDAAKGLRKNSSVGYMADPEKYVIEGELNGYPLVRCMRWTPYEASFVNVPADVAVGVGRSLENEHSAVVAETERENHMDPKEMAKLFERAAKFGIAADKVTALVADGKGRAELDAMIVDAQAENDAKQRAEIQALKERSKPEMPQRAQQPVITDGGLAAVPVKDMRKYSIVNVIRANCGDRVDIGLEREISDELAKQRGKGAQGIIVPHAALMNRAFTVSGTSSASVGTDLLAAEFIDLLRTKSILGALGVRFLPGLVGNVAIPKMSAGATGYWVAEATAITGSEPTLGQVTGTPHTCGVLVDISRKLINQSTPAAEMLVRDEIIERIARTIQIAVFAGTGSDGQPSAITTAAGINQPNVTQGTPTYAELLGFPGAIFADNAEGTAMAWAGTAEVWAKLAATAINGNGSAMVLDPATNRMMGRPFLTSEDLPANSLWFGDWSTVNVGIWGAGVDINVDDKTLSSSGGVRIVGLQDVDVMVRLGQKLAYNTAVTV